MTHEDYVKELLELIEYYRSIIYYYNSFQNYICHDCSLTDAEERLGYYKRLYEKETKEKKYD